MIPKIDAERLGYRKPAEKVVKMMADRNPQKLRQVGLQYDLAHAKGGVLDEDEQLQKKQAQQKMKKRKQKKKQDQVHEMEDAMRRMEGAMLQMRSEMIKELDRLEENQYHRDYKSKKKETIDEKGEDKKSSEEKRPTMPPSVKPPPGFWPEDSIKTETEIQPPPPPMDPSNVPKSEPTSVSPVESPDKPDGDKRTDGSSPNVSRGTMTFAAEKSEPDVPVSDSEIPKDHPPTPPTPIEPHSNTNSEASSDSGSDTDSASDVSDVESESEDERRPKKKEPWNAVCVLGLRVYAQHATVKVRLAEQENGDEEGSGLVTDGKAVGPTS